MDVILITKNGIVSLFLSRLFVPIWRQYMHGCPPGEERLAAASRVPIRLTRYIGAEPTQTAQSGRRVRPCFWTLSKLANVSTRFGRCERGGADDDRICLGASR
jgi:hypothetical protein